MIFPLAQKAFPAKKHLEDEKFQSTRKFWQTGAILCFAGGFLSLVSGILLIIITWFMNSTLSGGIAGRMVIIAAIPLMMLGAHCLDKLDLIENTAKKKRVGI
jgi:hypothetical protein